MFEPTQVIEFPGFMVDSLQMKIFLPTQIMKNIMKECRKVIQARNVLAHSLAHLIGKMTSTIPDIHSPSSKIVPEMANKLS